MLNPGEFCSNPSSSRSLLSRQSTFTATIKLETTVINCVLLHTCTESDCVATREANKNSDFMFCTLYPVNYLSLKNTMDQVEKLVLAICTKYD